MNEKKTIKRDYFWSGNCLMSSNNNGAFSSTHILELGRIKPEKEDKNLIESAPLLLEACQEFIRKCECGEAKSKRSYKQMKDAVNKALGVPDKEG